MPFSTPSKRQQKPFYYQIVIHFVVTHSRENRNNVGFVPVDAIRKRIWSNPDIRIFYRQNTMFFCTEQILASNSSLAKEFREINQDMLSIVHPEQYFISLKDHSPVGQLRSIVRKIPLAKKIYQFLREKCFAPDDARQPKHTGGSLHKTTARGE